MKLQNSPGRHLCMWLPLAMSLLTACLTLCGCVHALRPYNQPSEQKLRVQSPNPQQYSVAVADEAAVPIPADGRVAVHVPRLERGCATYVLGVKVKGGSPSDLPVIHLNRDSRTVRKLSLNDLAKLPLDDEGFRLLKAD